MKVKKKIHSAVEQMAPDDLSHIYDYIKALKEGKEKKTGSKILAIEDIHKLTGQSKSNWSDLVTEERGERF